MRACCILLAVVALAQTGPPDRLWREAVEHHQQGRLEQAVESYLALLKQQPKAFPVHTNLGAALAGLGRFEEAGLHYRKALEIQPGHFGTRLNLALAYYKQVRMDEAIAELESLRAAQPSNQQVCLLLGDSYLRLGRNAEVIALLDPLHDKQPQDQAISYLLGTALIRENQVERGQKIVDTVFRDASSAEALMLLAAAQFAAQENKKALDTLEKAIAKKPNLAELHSLYGKAKLTDGDPAGAKLAFLKELEYNPSDFDANLNLGAMFRLEGSLGEARTYLGRARRMRPHSPALQYQVANLELSVGNLEAATKILENVVKQTPQFLEAHITLATAYYRQKRKEDGDRHRAIVDKLNAEMQAKQLRTQ